MLEVIAMKKGKFIGVRLSDDTYEKLKIIAGDKGLSECIRDLVAGAYSGTKEDVKVFREFQSIVSELTNAISQLSEAKTESQPAQTDSRVYEYLIAVFSAIKLMGSLVIALPDKRKVFDMEMQKIESNLRGDYQ
jgi:predicted CopG family antitoxin